MSEDTTEETKVEDVKVEEPKVDLEALRDEKVIPVVRGVLTDMAGEIASTEINANTDFTSLLTKVLQRGLNADLNLTTENPYVFQLVLSVYGAFSSVVQGCKVADTPDERYGSIGRELLTLMASVEVPLGGKTTPDAQATALKVLQPQIEEIFARENLTWLEVKYIMEGLFRSLKATEQLYSSNVERCLKTMEAKILGIEDMTDLSMKKLDQTLQAGFEAVKQE